MKLGGGVPAPRLAVRRWRLIPWSGNRSSFELHLDATRREAADAVTEPGLKFRLNVRP